MDSADGGKPTAKTEQRAAMGAQKGKRGPGGPPPADEAAEKVSESVGKQSMRARS